MSSFTFLHAADLHLGSPFRGVTAAGAAGGMAEPLARALTDAPLGAFEALVEAALDRRAAFLLLAGDTAHHPQPSLRVRLALHRGLCRLAEAGISTFRVRGNHDPLTEGEGEGEGGRSAGDGLQWPDRVHDLGAGGRGPEEDRVETVAVPPGPGMAPGAVTVTGASFASPREPRNLARLFPRRRPGDPTFRIGLLHTDLGGACGPAHEGLRDQAPTASGPPAYAPCSLDDLLAAGLDYWALGHLHGRRVVHREPWVVYPGSAQGLDRTETGPRGALAVTVEAGRVVELEELDLAPVRWQRVEVSLNGVETLDGLLEGATGRLEEAAREAGRPLLARVVVTSPRSAPVLEHLGGPRERVRVHGDLLHALRSRFEATGPGGPRVWVEGLELPAPARRPSGGEADPLFQAVEAEAAALAEELGPPGATGGALPGPLWDDPRLGRALARPDADRRRRLVDEARELALDLLAGDPAAGSPSGTP